MTKFIQLIKQSIVPTKLPSNWTEIFYAIPRILCGLLLTLDFGSSKFGMPWSDNPSLGLLQVADWFPEDVAGFGFPFNLAPWLFAWLGAASEAIGGVFLALGLGTRFWAFMIMCTMLTAIFIQQWPKVMEQGSWPVLPALGFLWVSIYALIFGSGKFGLDYLISRKWKL